MSQIRSQDLGVPASPSGHSCSASSQSSLSRPKESVPNAAWIPMSRVPAHGRRIYALQRGGKATIIYANPELCREPYLGWWPLPEHGFALASGMEAAKRLRRATGSTRRRQRGSEGHRP
jgi:hypothetical protein